MSFSVRISCINKRDRYSAHERINNVGGVNPDGGRWKLTEQQAIEGIEQGKWSFMLKGLRVIAFKLSLPEVNTATST